LAPAPIVGATLKLDRQVMTERFVGMLNTETHWVFNKTRIHGLNGGGQTIAVVISGAHEQIGYAPEKILSAATRDLTSCLPGSGMPGFLFAGDWTRTGFPATIESACVSGERAALAILAA
jgi:hypothetical protein